MSNRKNKKIRLFGIHCLAFICFSARLHADQIAVFYALEKDNTAMAACGTNLKPPIKIGSRAIQRFNIGRHSIVAVKMGSGAVETAISAQALLARFHCDWAISLGPVGALSDSLNVGQWVFVKQAVAYDRGSVSEEGFAIKKESKDLKPEGGGSESPSIWKDLPNVVAASGEKFYASDTGRLELKTLSGADAVEMNLAGLLPVCEEHHLRSLHWRIVSDRADKEAPADFQKFVEKYDGAGGKIVGEWIATLPISPDQPEAYDGLRELLGK